MVSFGGPSGYRAGEAVEYIQLEPLSGLSEFVLVVPVDD